MESGRRICFFGLTVFLTVLLAGSAQAAMVRFLGVGDFQGFDSSTSGFPTAPDLLIEPSGLSLAAGPVGSGFDVLYTLEHCLLPSRRHDLPAGCGCGHGLHGSRDHHAGKHAGRSTLCLPGGSTFSLEGCCPQAIPPRMSCLTRISRLWREFRWTLFCTPIRRQGDRDYFGFRFSNLGDSLTLRYDVTAMQPSGTPVLFTSAYYPIPEPGTAVLLALGLIGMACRQRL